MTIQELTTLIPFTPETQTGRGFLPPLLRGLNHILFLLACLADDTIEVTNEQAINELTQAQDHWNAIEFTTNLSTAATAYVGAFQQTLRTIITDYHGWTNDVAISNLRDFTHRSMALAAFLDRELIGITNSDPGSTL